METCTVFGCAVVLSGEKGKGWFGCKRLLDVESFLDLGGRGGGIGGSNLLAKRSEAKRSQAREGICFLEP